MTFTTGIASRVIDESGSLSAGHMPAETHRRHAPTVTSVRSMAKAPTETQRPAVRHVASGISAIVAPTLSLAAAVGDSQREVTPASSGRSSAPRGWHPAPFGSMDSPGWQLVTGPVATPPTWRCPGRPQCSSRSIATRGKRQPAPASRAVGRSTGPASLEGWDHALRQPPTSHNESTARRYGQNITSADHTPAGGLTPDVGPLASTPRVRAS
nr:hypothetical protein [Deltaproteobacteria bacterium]